MLQLPESNARHSVRILSQGNGRTTTPIVTSLVEKAISDHKTAARILRNRNADLAKLEVLFPDMVRPDRADHAREKLRKAHGFPKAIMLRYRAARNESRTFDHFIATPPSSSAEVRRYASYLLTATARRVGGTFGSISTADLPKHGGWDAYEERRRQALHEFDRAVRALAKRHAAA
jgi:hypothetical protein